MHGKTLARNQFLLIFWTLWAAAAERRRAAWEQAFRRGIGAASAPFDLVVQPTVGGQEAAITLKGVWPTMTTAELHKRIHNEMKSKPHPDEQRLFIATGGQKPLSDETVPIGAYGVVDGVMLHLAMRDEKAAASRRAARTRRGRPRTATLHTRLRMK